METKVKAFIKLPRKKRLSPFGKAFFECHQLLQIAQFEADLEGHDEPDPNEFVDNYFTCLKMVEHDQFMKGTI